MQQQTPGLSLSGRDNPRVLVVHQRLLVAQVLARRLAQEPDLASVDGSDDLGQALRRAASVDLVLLDSGARLSDRSGLLSEILALPFPPLVLVLGEAGEDPVPALLAGARGWVPVDVTPEDLVDALRVVSGGHLWLPQNVYADVVERLVHTRNRQGRLSTLTARQLQVLQCLVDGESIHATAMSLFMSENTVRTHRTRLFAKLGVHSALEAVAIARDAGLSPR
ncbi:MAG: transcriptional regulator [Frankiales bacterium]|nr:transcriptional regulator [Frankiales bacterium]